MSAKKPKIIVFDLDYTLWPFHVDCEPVPFKMRNNQVVDSHGSVVKPFPDSPEILKQLTEEGYEIGVASRTGEIRGANQLLNLFGWEKYITYKEIYPGKKTAHFSKIKSAAGVEYKDMIFFDDEERNIYDLNKVGVLSIFVRNGMSHKVIEEGLRKFSNRKE